ncbi:histidine--tRNA ligase [Enterobacteriaceae endosymbiont of Macroplea mutica]|uniref:histidine--tRNA ligase n=1 Tax=Enterobacteriaceae endosymbiont of Macroplea mutica TaxID=2675791 RepID=UPI001448E1EA|nr:histidine--tRNA ligase [Enterobacteriaceae endosymbiont of Macroplea mutica]QJC31084.1 histidine--tRNA ligase [Enterobacteriaceae endosymbiont of Macroplea mutica]
MVKNINAVHGMHDYMFPETILWEYIEHVTKKILNNYGYQEIKIPIVEKNLLYHQTIGEDTDIVTKEMYNLYDKNGDMLTLRPEGTTGFIRAILEHNLLYRSHRLWYIGPMFRYERPQKGRYRQFHQIGIEALGLTEPYIDAEIIILTFHIWKNLNIIKYVNLEVNTIGSIAIRKIYMQHLKKFFLKNIKLLDTNSIKKINSNPLRILDSKNIATQQLLKQAPKLKNYLDAYSINNFNILCDLLNHIGIKFHINDNLVRGLDYYNDIVFEWTTINTLDTLKYTICGGGRYNQLIQHMSDKKQNNGVGCAIGIERVLLLLKNLKIFNIFDTYHIDIYLIPMKDNHILYKILEIREKIIKVFPKIRILVSYLFINIKKQIKKAIKQKAHFILIIGDDEISNNTITIKDLKAHSQVSISETQLITTLSKMI